MFINSDIRLFESENYTPHFTENVYFIDSRDQTVAKNVVQIANVVLIYIYLDGYFPKFGDIVTKKCE